MPSRIDPDSAGFLLNDLARLYRAEFERQIEAEATPVTPAEARALAHLARSGAVRQVRLAESLRISPMSLCGLVDRLEAAGLVARSDDPHDRRAKIVELTPRADAALATIVAAGRRAEAVARRGIADGDWQRFRAVAVAVRANLGEARAASAEPAAETAR